MPEEVLTDNGKQFTDRFGKGGEVLFDRICRDNGIGHRLTPPASPTTKGKVERFHGTLRRELLDEAGPFADWPRRRPRSTLGAEYNTDRPHQSLEMAGPGGAVQHPRPAERAGGAAAVAARRPGPARSPAERR